MDLDHERFGKRGGSKEIPISRNYRDKRIDKAFDLIYKLKSFDGKYIDFFLIRF